jgi:prepilin-type N-terminal cleavage/methylation domain-containing protein
VSTQRYLQTQRGFTILEMLVSMAIFLVICGAMFELLNLSQKKYSGETQLTAAYQDARLTMDQIVRDFNVSGYPPADLFSVVPASPQYATSPVAWSPNYMVTPCLIGTGGGGTCATPGDYDLVLETRLSTETNVSWIWYHLDNTTNTLYRAVVPKTSGDPLSTVQSSGQKVAFLANVMNNPGPTSPVQLAQITAQYPTMFPGGQPQPIFQYTCDTPGGPTPSGPCPLAGTNNSPQNIRDVNITLIVMTPQRDMQTQSLKLVELNGSGHRVNPVN